MLVAIGLLLGSAAQVLLTRRARRGGAPPGTLHDGHYVRQVGLAGPSVVLEAGLAATSLNWSLLQRELATRARTTSYDRIGLGWSAPVRGERSLRRWTDDLHRLIRTLDLPRPLILVGHSFGTFIVRAYAHRFPGDVTALVLVDPVMPEDFINLRLPARVRLWRSEFYSYVTAGFAVFGLVRLGLWGLLRRGGGNPGPVLGLSSTLRRIAVEVAKLPADVVPILQARWSEPRFFCELAASIRAMPACAAEAAAHPVPAGLPVVVFSGSHRPPAQLATHAAIATRHVVVPGSAHWIHLDQPRLVAEAVLALAQRG